MQISIECGQKLGKAGAMHFHRRVCQANSGLGESKSPQDNGPRKKCVAPTRAPQILATLVSIGKITQLLLVLLLIVIPTCACTNLGQEEGSRLQDSLSVLSVEDFWPQMLDLAQKWHSDAYVRGVRVEVELGNFPSTDALVEFNILSHSDDYQSYHVWCVADGCKSYKVEHKYSVMHGSPISLEDFALDSKKVLQIALQNGGENYYYTYLAKDDTTPKSPYFYLQLFPMSPSDVGPLRWRVHFRAMFSKKVFGVIIDAVTGEVVEIRD